MRDLFPQALPSALNTGRPSLALASTQFTPQNWEDAQAHIPKALLSAISLPVGGPPYPPLKPLLPLRHGTQLPSRSLRERLNTNPASDVAFSAWFVRNKATIIDGALGIGAPNSVPQCLLRQLTRNPSKPGQAALAASCAGRQWIQRFQSSSALDCIRSVIRTPEIPADALGIVPTIEAVDCRSLPGGAFIQEPQAMLGLAGPPRRAAAIH